MDGTSTRFPRPERGIKKSLDGALKKPGRFFANGIKRLAKYRSTERVKEKQLRRQEARSEIGVTRSQKPHEADSGVPDMTSNALSYSIEDQKESDLATTMDPTSLSLGKSRSPFAPSLPPLPLSLGTFDTRPSSSIGSSEPSGFAMTEFNKLWDQHQESSGHDELDTDAEHSTEQSALPGPVSPKTAVHDYAFGSPVQSGPSDQPGNAPEHSIFEIAEEERATEPFSSFSLRESIAESTRRPRGASNFDGTDDRTMSRLSSLSTETAGTSDTIDSGYQSDITALSTYGVADGSCVSSPRDSVSSLGSYDDASLPDIEGLSRHSARRQQLSRKRWRKGMALARLASRFSRMNMDSLPEVPEESATEVIDVISEVTHSETTEESSEDFVDDIVEEESDKICAETIEEAPNKVIAESFEPMEQLQPMVESSTGVERTFQPAEMSSISTVDDSGVELHPAQSGSDNIPSRELSPQIPRIQVVIPSTDDFSDGPFNLPQMLHNSGPYMRANRQSLMPPESSGGSPMDTRPLSFSTVTSSNLPTSDDGMSDITDTDYSMSEFSDTASKLCETGLSQETIETIDNMRTDITEAVRTDLSTSPEFNNGFLSIIRSHSPGAESNRSQSPGSSPGPRGQQSRNDGGAAKDDPNRDPLKRQRNGQSGDEGGDDREKKKVRRKPAGPKFQGTRLACPFFQNNPHDHQQFPSCSGPGWPSVHRVK
jgi:hypothetical protein